MFHSNDILVYNVDELESALQGTFKIFEVLKQVGNCTSAERSSLTTVLKTKNALLKKESIFEEWH